MFGIIGLEHVFKLLYQNKQGGNKNVWYKSYQSECHVKRQKQKEEHRFKKVEALFSLPKIVSRYGKGAIKIEKNRIIVTIPFQRIDNETHAEVKNKAKININDSQKKIIETMRDNPNVKTVRLMAITGLSESGVNRNLKKLKELGLIERIESLKNGYWSVKE